MARLSLVILCVGLWLLGTSATQTSALSDKSEFDECESFECPLPECSNDDNEYLSFDFQLEPISPHRPKRDLSTKESSLLERCCNCSCNDCQKMPICKEGQVIIELSKGNGKPGSCCPKYECGIEPKCVKGAGVTFWRNSCTKCNSCQVICLSVKECELKPLVNCSINGTFKYHGDSWTQDNYCQTCSCNNGDIECTQTDCQKLDCDNSERVEGECCPVCPIPIPSAVPTSTLATEAATSTVTTTTSTVTTTTSTTTSTTTTEATSTASSVTTEGAIVQSSSTGAEISSESIENTTEPVQLREQQAEQNNNENEKKTTTFEDFISDTTISTISTSVLPEDSTEDALEHKDNAEILSTSAASTFEDISSSTEVRNDVEQTVADVIEHTTLNDAMITSGRGGDSNRSSTTEHPNSLATSAPAAQTPESTSWHRDSTIDDADYRFANENQIVYLTYPKYLYWILCSILIFVCSVLALFICYCKIRKPNKQRESRSLSYSSVPNSDTNLSQHTPSNTGLIV